MYWLFAKWRLLAAAALLAAVVLVLYVLTIPSDEGKPETHGSTGESIGEGVSVSGQAIPNKLKATKARPEVLSVDVANLVNAKLPTGKTGKKQDLVRQLALLEIGPYHGKLDKPMRVTIPIKGAVIDKNNTLVVMTRPTDGDDNSWTALTPIDPKTGKARRPKAGDTTVTVEMTHLSILGVFNVFTGNILKALANIVDSEVFKEAQPPKCPNPDKAKADRYALKKPSTNALLTCVGYDGKNYVMHVVNNRRYLLELSWSRAKISEGGGKFTLDMTELYKLRNKGVPHLRPREEALVVLENLKDGEKATVSSALSNWGMGVDALDRTARGLLQVVYGPGTKTADKTQKILKFMLDSTECNNSLNSGDVNLKKTLESCMDVSVLKELLGAPAAILLAPVAAAISLLDTGRMFANAIGDRRNNRDRATAVVSRENQFAGFTGKWTRHYGTLSIDQDGSAKIVESTNCIEPGGNALDADTHYCQEAVQLKLTLLDDKSLRGVMTAVTYYVDEKPVSLERYLELGDFGVARAEVGDTVKLSMLSYGRVAALREGAKYGSWQFDDYEGEIFCGSQRNIPLKASQPCGA